MYPSSPKWSSLERLCRARRAWPACSAWQGLVDSRQSGSRVTPDPAIRVWWPDSSAVLSRLLLERWVKLYWEPCSAFKPCTQAVALLPEELQSKWAFLSLDPREAAGDAISLSHYLLLQISWVIWNILSPYIFFFIFISCKTFWCSYDCHGITMVLEGLPLFPVLRETSRPQRSWIFVLCVNVQKHTPAEFERHLSQLPM